MSPVRYELGSYIPEDGILSRRRENLKCYVVILVSGMELHKSSLVMTSRCRLLYATTRHCSQRAQTTAVPRFNYLCPRTRVASQTPTAAEEFF
jgi:hypothetical protein